MTYYRVEFLATETARPVKKFLTQEKARKHARRVLGLADDRGLGVKGRDHRDQQRRDPNLSERFEPKLAGWKRPWRPVFRLMTWRKHDVRMTCPICSSELSKVWQPSSSAPSRVPHSQWKCGVCGGTFTRADLQQVPQVRPMRN